MFTVKDIRKLVVVSIIGACAVFVANLFLNFYLDIEQLEISKTNPMIMTYYDAQVSLSWMVAMVSGETILGFWTQFWSWSASWLFRFFSNGGTFL